MPQRKLPQPDEWEAWRHNEITQFVLGLYRDQAADIRHAWSQGNEWTDEARWAVQTYEDMVAIELDDLREFYSEDDDDEAEPEGG